jgi:UDP-MurNAc hydroxylase
MRVTFLGHAGFLVETADALLLADPWLSAGGAFDGAWFQYPCNHHLAPYVRERFAAFEGECYVYVSHEHPDHYDRAFLATIASERVTLVIPHFTNDRMERETRSAGFGRVLALRNNESVPLGAQAKLTLYVDDTELNRDSAILVRDRDGSFFNMNDCKLFDALPAIVEREGNPDVFTCQYSGAIWHPTCYEYDAERYAAISKKKYLAKFEAVARAIDLLRPKLYFPSAGPPCFLDPDLFALNEQETNIFPAAEKVLAYLERRLQKNPVPLFHAVPGDRIEISNGYVDAISLAEHVAAEERISYLRRYARQVGPVAADLRHADPQDVFARLRAEMDAKLERFRFAERIDVPLYLQIAELPNRVLRIDFQARAITEVASMPSEQYYALAAPAWTFRRVLERKITWDEFGLGFRVRLRREPDVYQPFLYAFLILEIDTIDLYCRRMEELEARGDRIVVESGGKKYSILRYCPHMGADLTAAHVDDNGILTCPRHRWQYDLTSGGVCTNNAASICAVELETPAYVNR